jgi:hypothetical protein
MDSKGIITQEINEKEHPGNHAEIACEFHQDAQLNDNDGNFYILEKFGVASISFQAEHGCQRQ